MATKRRYKRIYLMITNISIRSIVDQVDQDKRATRGREKIKIANYFNLVINF